MPKVSVVIPVYRVEPYIERCLHSLFGQTLDELEYLFVDDCSDDASLSKIRETLERYPERKSQTRILRHQTNRGVAAARATGILAATGDYIIHCDPDDYVELDMYEKLYDKAMATQADITACYFLLESAEKTAAICKKYDPSPQICLKNIYKKNRHCGALYDKLVRRELINRHHIVPYEGCDYAEDFYCVVKTLYYARSLAVVEKPLYHYCIRDNSITSAPKNRYYWNMRKDVTDRICEFLSREKIYKTACSHMRFYIKMEYRAAFAGNEQEWFNIYRTSHKYILRYDDMPLKVRIFWWLALQNPTTYRIARKLMPKIR